MNQKTIAKNIFTDFLLESFRLLLWLGEMRTDCLKQHHDVHKLLMISHEYCDFYEFNFGNRIGMLVDVEDLSLHSFNK